MSWVQGSAPTLRSWEGSVDPTDPYRDILSETHPSLISSTAITATTTAPSAAGVLSLLHAAFRAVRNLALFFMSAAGSAVAAMGLALLGYLLLTRALTPSQHMHSRSLYLDYSQKDLVAQAAFLPGGDDYSAVAAPPNLPPNTRFLPPGQRVDVWVELQLPSSTANCKGGMAQVTAELVTLDGRTAGRASRPILLRNGSWGLWSLATAPLRWVGLLEDARTLRVPIFHNYQEKEATPFVVFQLAIKTRDPSWAPEVLAARVVVQLRLGFLRRLLYTLRPGALPMLLLAAAALSAVLGGSTAALVFLTLWLYYLLGGSARSGGPPAPGAPSEEVSSLGSAAEDESSSVGGGSETESVDRRGSGEGLHGGAAAAAFRRAPSWPELEEDWQDIPPETSAAAATIGAGSQGRAAGGATAAAARGKGPASAVSTDDTAFLGPDGLRRRSSMGGKGPTQ